MSELANNTHEVTLTWGCLVSELANNTLQTWRRQLSTSWPPFSEIEVESPVLSYPRLALIDRCLVWRKHIKPLNSLFNDKLCKNSYVRKGARWEQWSIFRQQINWSNYWDCSCRMFLTKMNYIKSVCPRSIRLIPVTISILFYVFFVVHSLSYS